jgi:hypothetical protein
MLHSHLQYIEDACRGEAIKGLVEPQLFLQLVDFKEASAPVKIQEEHEADHTTHCALIKKKIKFSSYIGKFRVEQLQSHI